MILIYIFLSLCLFILSGMWLSTICVDYYENKKISIIQYFWTSFTFLIGLLQLSYAFKTFSI